MKKIALIADIKGWAFDGAAHLIKKALEDECIVDIFYRKENDVYNDVCDILVKVYQYDVIHFFWRKELTVLLDEENINRLISQGIDIEVLKSKLSTGIYDHLLINDQTLNPVFNDLCKKYVTSSLKILNIYCENKDIKSPYMILGDTFDETKFFPREKNKKYSDDVLVIGWVGNSKWSNHLLNKSGNPIDYKGLNTILKPVIAELKAEGYKIEGEYADRNIKQIHIDEMPNYYQAVDLVACVSIVEGTPKPILEAMGMGIPMISTDVGIVNEYFGEQQKSFIIGERNEDYGDEKIRQVLKEKIIEIYNNRNILDVLSKENYEQSKIFNCSAYKEKYKEYFLNF